MRSSSYITIYNISIIQRYNWSTVMKKVTENNYSDATAIEAMNWDYKHLSAELKAMGISTLTPAF